MLGDCYYRLCGTRAGHGLAKRLIRAVRCLGARRAFHPPFDALDLDHDALAGLTALWRRIHWSAGDGMMPPEELLTVYRLAATWPARGDIVELGAWVGLTTSYLATACRVRGDGRVHAVDTFAGTKEGSTTYSSVNRFGGSTLHAFRAQIRRAGVEEYVRPAIGLTSEMAGCYAGRPIRLLLIDADHSFDGVRRDFELWSPHVAPGGLIVFHDYLMPDVARFVNECIVGRPDLEMSPGRPVANLLAVTKRATKPLSALDPHRKSDSPGDTRTPARSMYCGEAASITAQGHPQTPCSAVAKPAESETECG